MKALERTLIILIIILLALISFGGILVQKTKFVENILPKYKLGSDLSEQRNVTLAVSDAKKDVFYDLNGNVVDKEGENTTKQEEAINKEDTLTKENYKEVKKIVETRLNNFKKIQYTPAGLTENKAVDYYTIKQDEETGKIMLKIPETESTDMLLQYVAIRGNFTITDDQEKVLMDNSHIKEAKVGYNSTESGTTVYLTIQFNKEGTEKLKEISNTFIKTTDEEGNDTTKKISVKIDDTEMLSTYFAEEISNGIIQLSFGAASTDGTEVASYAQEASNLAVLLNTGNLPIVYTIEENRYILSNNNIEEYLVPEIVVMSLALISIVVLIIKYKANGLLATLSIVGYVATLLIIIRLTNVVLTIEGITGILVSVALDYIFILYLLETKHKKVESGYGQVVLKFLPILMPVAIATIIFCFVKWLPIYSFGMAMFWGIVLIMLYNLVITKALVFEKK